MEMSTPTGSCHVAIVGLAAELPGGTEFTRNLDIPSFFPFLLQKGQAYEKIPIERFNVHTLKGSGSGKVITDVGAFLKDVHLFDFLEFAVASKDAVLMPLSTRKLIETTFLALLDSGIHYRGQNIGCFMAGVGHDLYALSGHDDTEARGSFASAPSTIANRVSYHLDLRGPSIPTDTACSSSLTATHLAVQALRNGECEAAVVGGCQINHRFTDWVVYSQGGVLSPDGKCKPFDASANGFGRGEGAVSIVLKPLDAALRDHDKIYGTILGTGINSSGSLAPVNAPVALAQQDAMKRAFAMARRQPTEVDFIELHATGTAQGDPTEANWVGEQSKRDDELLIGSLKGNLGHLEIAAFLASLCKVCSMFQTGLIPPNVNLTKRNPTIKWDQYKFRVPLEAEPLPCRSPSGRSLVSLTSSGITGVNGHCVVEGPPSVAQKPSIFWTPEAIQKNAPALLISGGLTPRSVSAVADSILNATSQSDCSVQTLSRIYGRRSRSFTWRSFAIASNGNEPRFTEHVLCPKHVPEIVFVFSGQGPQHFDMGRDLFRNCLVFRSSVLEMDDIYRSVVGHSLIERYGLFADVPQQACLEATWPIAITLPALAVVHMALFDTLSSIGVKPDIVLGHSAGETAVLYASGSATKAMALEVAIARGKAMSLLEDHNGAMAALSCSPQEAGRIIEGVVAELGPGSIQIGCYNTPGAVTLSGAGEYIDLAVQKAQAAGMFGRRLRTRVPVHSTMMELCKTEYQDLVGEVFARHQVVRPTVATCSTKTGEFVKSMFDADYFWQSTRGPVLFTTALQAVMNSNPNATYVEIGPHPVLSGYISALAGKTAIVTCPMKRSKISGQGIEVQGILETLGKLIVAGHSCVDFDAICGVHMEDIAPAAMFPLARKDVPYFAPTAEISRQRQLRNGPLNYPQLHINAKTHPELAQHVINDEPIMPAAGYLEMVLEFGARQLWNVEFISILPLSSDRPIPIEIKLDGCKWSIHSASPGTNTWPPTYNRLHAHGHLSIDPVPDDGVVIGLSEILDRLKIVNMKDFYRGFSNFAQYGPIYQRVVACYRGFDPYGREEVLVQIRGNDLDIPEIDDFRFHPAILDGAVHIGVHPMLTCYKGGPRYYLPSVFGAVMVHEELLKKPFPKTIFSHYVLVKWTLDTIVYDVTIVNENGTRLMTIDGLEVALHGDHVQVPNNRFEVVHHPSGLSIDPNFRNNTVRAELSRKCKHFPPIWLEYVRGKEMETKAAIVKLDALAPLAIWIVGIAGLDGDASLGFSRSLRKEYPIWTIRTAVFDSSWSVEARQRAYLSLQSISDCETELNVDASGMVSVPRIVPSSPPSSRITFRPNSPWQYESRQFKHISEPTPSAQHILIQVSSVSKPKESSLWSFIGHVKGSSRRVAGISTDPLSNIVVAHRESIFDLPDNTLEPNVLVYAIVGLALGNSLVSKPERLHNLSVLVVESDDDIGSHINDICALLGAQVTLLPTHSTVSEIRSFLSKRPQVVISSANNCRNQIFKDLLHADGKLFLWSDAQHGVPHILRSDPWAVGDVLQSVQRQVPTIGCCMPPLLAADIAPPAEVEVEMPLFDPGNTYLLVGGIGSLGIEIAYWMYQKGARYIVLTSRSGRESISQKGTILSKRLLTHLEGLPGLSLHLTAADAQSSVDMQRVLASLERPVAGCMLLSGVLVDRSFIEQTQETFEAPFPAKVDAFRVLEKLLPVEFLDFLITFSSVSGMFGNAGQTNYASANTALAGLTKAYRNAFCMVVPIITDSAVTLNEDTSTRASRITHLTNWGMTSSELCACIEDGILKLRQDPIWQYIPNFDWNLVQENMGPSSLYAHLVSIEVTDNEVKQAQEPTSVRDVVCRVLSVASEDLSMDVPLTAYGLDSLSAASLSYSLNAIVAVSQIQLLADMTLRQLEARLEVQGSPGKKAA